MTNMTIKRMLENKHSFNLTFRMFRQTSSEVTVKVPLTPKMFFALLQNVSDLEMFKTKIKKIHKILTLLWTFKVAMFSFSTAL